MILSDIKNKKIAVGLFGISYRQNYQHWMGWNTNIDWRKANTHSALIPFFAEKNEVDTYITTYHSDLDLDLLRDFSPKSYIFNDFQCNKAEKTWVRDKHLRFKETLWLLNRSKIAYDYYVITRFDFDFRMNYFRNGKFDHEAINVTAQWCVGEDCSFVDDCFFIFHKSMLPSFTRLIESLPPDNGDIAYYHKLHKYPNSPKFSFLIDGSYWSHTCPALQVVRQ
tara:strand:+ start:2403 stop:3071 length:669 start_codon:yes stop_codon:yes gene_type:complete